MIDHAQFTHEIDRYINGEMTPEESQKFEVLCNNDPVAKALRDEQITFRLNLVEHADRQKLKNELDEAYRSWKAEEEPTRAKVVKMKKFFWKPAIIAAAIALLITSGGLWLTMSQYNNHKKNSYTILRREIDNIKRSQTDLINDFHSASAPANPGQFGGTGFALSADGYLATNAHVVKDADSVYVVTHKGESLKANIIYQDTECDLAILKIVDSSFRMPALPFVLRKTPAPLGDEVYTLGYPRDEIVYGKGYISAETGFRGDSNAYQIAIPVNPGNSGGPLVDSKGQILGIISGKQSSSDDIAFAVKSSFLLDMLDSLPTDFNQKALEKKYSPLQRMSRIDQIKKLQEYIFLVRVYN